MLVSRFNLDKKVISLYALLTTVLFIGIGAYYLAGSSASGLGKAMLMMEVQAYALFIFVLVCLTSIFGSVYYHMQKKKIRRNTFAFVFSASMLKWVVGMLVFGLHPF